ncbi:hypothetical protein EIK77_000847 [Talaromyces pinophilus]|nr:hypothetical protein EIK77_006434 [Talaromyces pinophilus]KAI7975487.1 hypothetical protein EIK77_000859 [Talaromyces pinophilus]KAI7976009.1 hypothetical protein EIK77_000922 [Talaromyces pinophilus]KAI7978469.1 hypothetical protein EIK77_000847 [Talaromyces pinophilus]
MEVWNCPSCFEHCDGPRELIEHIHDNHIYEGPELSLGIKGSQTHSNGVESDVESNDSIQYICPFPGCVNMKQYSTKYNLLRHYFDRKNPNMVEATYLTDLIDSTYTKQDRLLCPNCNKRQKSLGSLTRHWDKSCKKRFGRHGCITAEQQHLLHVLNREKKRATADMNAALRQMTEEGATRKLDSMEVSENGGRKSKKPQTNESVELTVARGLFESAGSDAAGMYLETR